MLTKIPNKTYKNYIYWEYFDWKFRCVKPLSRVYGRGKSGDEDPKGTDT